MSTTAHVVLPCDELDPTVTFLTELGFRVDAVFPADDPAVTRLSGHGLGVELRRGPGDPGRIRVCLDGVGEVTERVAPNGTVVELAPLLAPLHVPPLHSELVVTHVADGASWVVGRAGMRYRDLLPGRLGGRFIASHIHVPDGGPVPDYVHYHHVRFQMIFVARGWVRLVYEDQGEPFVLHAGDCVLQPPLIRHRVLESSPNLEVIEIGCPAEHETLVEHEFDLPTAVTLSDRDFSGQRFVRHTAATAPRLAWLGSGFEARDTGIAVATDGLADARVVKGGAGAYADVTHHGELWFAFVLEGAVSLDVDGTRHELVRDDAVSVPPGAAAELSVGDHAELLIVSLPGIQH